MDFGFPLLCYGGLIRHWVGGFRFRAHWSFVVGSGGSLRRLLGVAAVEEDFLGLVFLWIGVSGDLCFLGR